jgi:hypothetical protein
MAKYLILIYGDERIWEAWSADEQRANGDAHAAFNAAAGDAVLGGHELKPSDTATSVRADPTGGQTVTDGPFLETKEVLGGYYLVEAANLDDAIALAKRLPEAAAPSSGVEIRPIQGAD